ncbi:hypothetical protein AG1IA_06814 [Rhizoctonia solani AG-1 IA]|uniref:Uncharacterized protein n=1 Tax=Thanatephorus cucumeris (strain AG1-IA) TaxID=983506 RepID=L8WQW6_THACA|nr:hypothetical protein AG1IA_06814 [Rhizoctonia solani AG-1 IA]
MNDKSYMGTGSPSSDRFAFFAKGAYDEGAHSSVTARLIHSSVSIGAFKQAYNTKQTHTLGEFLTIGEPISKPATDYKGHVFVVTGEKDIIFCGGNCLQKSTTGSGSSLLDDTKPLYPNAASFSTYVTPGAGHALFTHYGTAETISSPVGMSLWVYTSNGREFNIPQVPKEARIISAGKDDSMAKRRRTVLVYLSIEGPSNGNRGSNNKDSVRFEEFLILDGGRRANIGAIL